MSILPKPSDCAVVIGMIYAAGYTVLAFQYTPTLLVDYPSFDINWMSFAIALAMIVIIGIFYFVTVCRRVGKIANTLVGAVLVIQAALFGMSAFGIGVFSTSAEARHELKMREVERIDAIMQEVLKGVIDFTPVLERS
ncbi:hypothetical protein [Mesorhizobium sp. A623]